MASGGNLIQLNQTCLAMHKMLGSNSNAVWFCIPPPPPPAASSDPTSQFGMIYDPTNVVPKEEGTLFFSREETRVVAALANWMQFFSERLTSVLYVLPRLFGSTIFLSFYHLFSQFIFPATLTVIS
jgi:hypothetical protein